MKKNYKLLVPTPSLSTMKIGTRIFILVGFCLGLLALISGIGIWHINQMSLEIERIAQKQIPLTRDLTKITIHQFEQSNSFERAFRSGQIMKDIPDAREDFELSVQTFKQLAGIIDKEFTELESVTNHGHEVAMEKKRRHEFHNVMQVIGELSQEHKDFDQLAMKAFKLIDTGKLEQALALLPRIETKNNNLDHQLGTMLLEVGEITERTATMLEQNEKFTLYLLVVLTIIALIIGLGPAVFIVRRSITYPLREIVTGLDALSSGDMSLEVKVHNDDEIGAVARSYEVFKHSLMKLKRREAELESGQKRFKNLVESTNVVPWVFYPQTMRFTYVGPQAVALFGYRPVDWYAEGFWESIIHPDDREETIRISKESAELHEDHDFEYRIMTADGGHVWVRDVSSVVRDDRERMMFRGIFIDITAMKNSEVKLLESEQRFKDIAEVSSDWIWECDENLRFTYLSDRFKQVAGVTKEQILGKTRHEVGRGTVADWDSHLADLEAQRSFRAFNYSVKDANGELLHWVTSGRPVFDADGSFKGYRGTGADRSTEVRIQAELVRHRDHLQELVDTATQELKVQAVELLEALAKEKKLNKLQRQFVSMASHEFRTPLAIIDATAQRMKSRAGKNQLTPEEAFQRVEKIRDAVRRMTRLMDSTLTAARMDEGKIEIEIGPCDIGKVVQEVCERQQEIAGTHVISCDLAGLPETIRADTNSVEQVLANLLSNAVKYAPDAPDIEVTARTEGDHVVVQVHDHGIGIDQDDLNRIGERFFRARTSAGIAGTGIGLNLVKTLVERHGGSISLQSKPGEGSTFTVRLPVAGPSKTEQAA